MNLTKTCSGCVVLFAGLVAVTADSCGVEARCKAIALGTAASSLPVLPAGSFTLPGQPLVGPAKELGCCVGCNGGPDAGAPRCSCPVDCNAYRGLEQRRLGAPYDEACQDSSGVMMCNVLVFDGGVVAVNGRCEE